MSLRIPLWVFVLGLVPAYAQTSITFNDLPNAYFFTSGGQNIGSYYPGVGIGPNVTALSASRFGGYDSAAYPPHSGDVVIWDASDNTIGMTFTSAIQSFSFWYTSIDSLTVTAYDSSNFILTTITAPPNTDGVTGSTSLVQYSNPAIKRVTVSGPIGMFTLSGLTYLPTGTVPGAIRVSLTASPTSPSYGQPVTLRAIVATLPSPGIIYTGPANVTFYDGAIILGTAPVLPLGVATLTTTYLASGVHTLWAHSAGNSVYYPGNSEKVLQVVAPLAESTFNLPATIATGTNPQAIAAADVNKDGIIDLVVADYGNYNIPNVSVFLGNGDGTFQSPRTFLAGTRPYAVAIGDFNGDGNPDLAVANFWDNNVSILLGNGDGTFQAAVNYSVGAFPTSLVVGDFNGDGKADLAVAGVDGIGNNAIILLGNGNGTFQAPIGYGANANSSSPWGIAAGDFNGDGKTDLAVIDHGSSKVGVLLGNGDGTFQSEVSYSVGLNPLAIATGDLNGDGKPDLIVASYYGPSGSSVANSISVLIGQGNGAFSPAVQYAAGAGASSVVAADIDGDGVLDLAVSSSTNNTVSILLGSGNGTFPAAKSYAVGASPSALVLADFNRDGRPDLAVANYGANTIAILLGAAKGPANVSVTPNSGSGANQIFTASYSDPLGFQDIARALFMVASTPDGVSGCAVMWDRNSGNFYLANDIATVWTGPIQSGGSTVENSQCLLQGSTSSASGTGNSLTVNFGVTFKNGFTGTRNIYLEVSGVTGNSGWQVEGSWLPGAQPPTVGSATPSGGTGTSQVFTATYGDVQGYRDITQALFMVAANTSGAAGCVLMWDRPSNNFYLANDAATSWTGPIVAGGGGTLQNSQCVLNGATSSGNGALNTLTANFGLTFKPAFTGSRNIYLLAYGSVGNSGWQRVGTWTPATAQAPANGTVAPSSGTGSSQVFTATYLDSQGYQDISQALFMMAGNTSGAGGCVTFWDRANNNFYLANNAATAWLAPVQGGSGGTVQNSQCVLSGATSSGNGSGNTLTVHFGLSFLAAFTGVKNTYLLVYGSAGNSGWQQEGTWTPGAPLPPTNGIVTPVSGSGLSQIFTATYSDAQGYQDISQALFMMAGNTSGAGGCVTFWDRASNNFYLANDTATAWLTQAVQGGSGGTVQNGQCVLSGATSSGGGSGSTLTVHFGLTFLAGFTGVKNTYLLVYGGAGNSVWQQEGTWTPGALQPPTNGLVTPASGSGAGQIFTATYSDAQGYQDINQALFMMAGNTSGAGGCVTFWDRANNNFYLANNAATAWLAPVQGGSGGTVQNSQCVLSGATSSGNGSGNTLTVHFGLSFLAAFTGVKNTYLLVYGSAGNSGWQQEGTWTPGAPLPPTNGIVTPVSGSGLSQIFTATYSDAQGYQDISQALFMMAGNTSGAGGCVTFWDRASNNFYLANDAATAWLPPVQGGSGGSVQNSQCILSGATSSGGGSGNTLTVHFGLSFLAGFTGVKNTYLLVYGSAGNSQWQQAGTWMP